jgi:tetratricopeptide (TPR) repeat protein
MMRTLRFLMVCSLLAAGTVWAQDWKGKATVSGTVTDPAGKGIGGATVTLTFVDLKAGPPEAKTNGKGEWEVKNVAEGKWMVRVAKEKYEPKEAELQVGGEAKNPHVTMRLAPVGSGDANAELSAGDQKARALMAEKKYAEARAIYQGLLAKYPKAVRIHIALAQTYEADGQSAKAAEELKTYLETDPSNVQMAVFYASELAKAGNADESLKVLSSIPPTAVNDLVDLHECGRMLMQAKKFVAAQQFYEEAVKRFPNEAVNYYLRGLSEYLIGANVEKPNTSESKAHLEKAKADMNKFLQVAPKDDPSAANAKKILETIKTAGRPVSPADPPVAGQSRGRQKIALVAFPGQRHHKPKKGKLRQHV